MHTAALDNQPRNLAPQAHTFVSTLAAKHIYMNERYLCLSKLMVNTWKRENIYWSMTSCQPALDSKISFFVCLYWLCYVGIRFHIPVDKRVS